MSDTDRPAPAEPRIVLERTVAAPIELVWSMWTDPNHFRAWYGPTGATVPVAELDVRVGGRRFVGMEIETPSGTHRMWFVGEHLQVDAPVRLVYTESLADEHGTALTPADAGMPADHPTVTKVAVELSADGDRTHLVLTHAGVPSDSPGAMGWRMALDALDEYVTGLA